MARQDFMGKIQTGQDNTDLIQINGFQAPGRMSRIQFENLHGLSRNEMKKLNFGDYVDVVQTSMLQECVRALLYKLKELYFMRKVKPQKGKYKKTMAAPKKRYIIGLKEVTKNLGMQKVNMVILATNMEKVQGEHGIDEKLMGIKDECRRQGVPLVISMSRA